jgi:NADP-dependent 3-hydroxy acid dehydrogenase YdfG
MSQVDTAALFSLAGKVALVTGGSSGIGAMVAGGLLRAGASVYIASRKSDTCDRVANELSSIGRCVPVPADVASPEGRAALVEALTARETGLHILVNNAGTSWGAPYEAYPDSAFDKVLGLNVTAPFALTRDLTPLLERAATADDPARVVNVGSIAGIRAERLTGTGTFAYSASKAALHHLTRTLAAELGPRHLREPNDRPRADGAPRHHRRRLPARPHRTSRGDGRRRGLPDLPGRRLHERRGHPRRRGHVGLAPRLTRKAGREPIAALDYSVPRGRSGFPGPKCLSMTMGSVFDGLVTVTPSRAAASLTKSSSWVS